MILKGFIILCYWTANGNGRNFAFLYLQNHLKSGSYIFIDDHTHYDFVERFLSIYNAEVYFENIDNSIGNKWTTGGNFIIYKILENENV